MFCCLISLSSSSSSASQRAQEEVHSKELKVKLLTDSVNSFIAKAPPTAHDALRSELEILTANYQRLCSRLDGKCKTLEVNVYPVPLFGIFGGSLWWKDNTQQPETLTDDTIILRQSYGFTFHFSSVLFIWLQIISEGRDFTAPQGVDGSPLSSGPHREYKTPI